jgi:hypothetical protein
VVVLAYEPSLVGALLQVRVWGAGCHGRIVAVAQVDTPMTYIDLQCWCSTSCAPGVWW